MLNKEYCGGFDSAVVVLEIPIDPGRALSQLLHDTQLQCGRDSSATNRGAASVMGGKRTGTDGRQAGVGRAGTRIQRVHKVEDTDRGMLDDIRTPNEKS